MTAPVLAVVGASGAGRRVLDISLDALAAGFINFSAVVVVDDGPSDADLAKVRARGIEYAGTSEQWLRTAPPSRYTIGIGDNQTRARIRTQFDAYGHVAATLVAPTARVSKSAVVASGCVISPGADVSADADVGEFVHVMANVAVSHDVTIGHYANLNPGSVIAGNSVVGQDVTIGAAAVVLQGITIGDEATVGAAACVTRDVPSGAVVKGVPAR